MNSDIIYHPNSVFQKTGFDSIREASIKKCYTPYGHELLEKFMPSADEKTVSHHLKLASEWLHLLQSGASHPLTTVNDLRIPLKESRVEGAVLPLEDFVVILQNARLARLIKSFFGRSEFEYSALHNIVDKLIECTELEDAIRKVVTDRGELRDDASAELKTVRKRLNREKNRLRSTIQQVMKRVSKEGMTSDEGPTIRNGRMVIPIQAEFKRKVEGFVQDVSSTGQTIYIEPVQALQINNDIRQLEAEESQEIERIIRELTRKVQTFRTSLLNNCEHIAKLDAIHSKVSLGLNLDGVIPVLSDDNSIRLINAKNPILLLKNTAEKDADPVVPLNLQLSAEELALIITGPNAGGKSVAMKTVGLLNLMIQSGYPVPVQPDSSIPIAAGIFVDVGDDQSIENDLSTFSSRLNWMKETLKRIQPGSLVLIDEAGAGTDPEEGGALFQAFIESVLEHKSRVIVTTHHGSLKIFAHETEGVVNGAMEFNQEGLSPTYRFKKGVPGSSYAFEIADRMNLPKRLMDQARNLLGEKRDKMGELLINLEKQLQEAEELYASHRKKLQDVERREKIYLDKASNFENKRKKILEKAYKDAEEIMKGANRRIEEAVEKVVQEGREDKDKIREARSEINEAKKDIHHSRKEFDQEEEKPFRSKETPAVGDYVLVGESDTSGELVDISGKNATVLVNGMKIKSKLDKLIKTTPPKKKKKSSLNRTYSGAENIDLSVSPRLDLRGKRGDEAIKELTLYLDKVVARGLNEVEIIHGKGEGILHKLVNEYLEKRKEVNEFEIAPWESGGSGCTIVRL